MVPPVSSSGVHAAAGGAADADQASVADFAAIARGQWGIESMHWLRDTEDANTGYAGNVPRPASQTTLPTPWSKISRKSAEICDGRIEAG